MSIPTNGKENKYPHLPRMNQLCIASRNCLYRLAYSESLSTQVAEAMLLQHRETDRRQPGGRPRARSSRVVPAIHGRIVEGESGSFSSAGGTISINTCSTYPSETKQKQDSSIQLANPQRDFIGCALNAEERLEFGPHASPQQYYTTNHAAARRFHAKHAKCIASRSFECLTRNTILQGVHILHFIQHFFDDQDFARVMGPTRSLQRNLEYVRKAHRRLRSCTRRLARAERRTDQRLHMCELVDGFI